VLVGDLTVDGEDEPLPLPDVGDPLETQPRQGTGDGLALRVEDLGLEHDVDDDASHGRKAIQPGQPNRRPVRRS
jgi:hypothetical protein